MDEPCSCFPGECHGLDTPGCQETRANDSVARMLAKQWAAYSCPPTGSWAQRWIPGVCKHKEIRCTHGDEIIGRRFRRRVCFACGRALRGPLPVMCFFSDEPHTPIERIRHMDEKEYMQRRTQLLAEANAHMGHNHAPHISYPSNCAACAHELGRAKGVCEVCGDETPFPERLLCDKHVPGHGGDYVSPPPGAEP